MKLIDNWRDSWKFWSVRAHAVETAFWAILLSWSDMGVYLWNMMPQEVKDLLPERAIGLIPLVFFGGTLLARMKKQFDGGGDDGQDAS